MTSLALALDPPTAKAKEKPGLASAWSWALRLCFRGVGRDYLSAAASLCCKSTGSPVSPHPALSSSHLPRHIWPLQRLVMRQVGISPPVLAGQFCLSRNCLP